MATVHDVAAYILRSHGQMSAMKLQKLIYYSQAWSLVWDEAPLFSEPIKAWINGPVVYELFDKHRGDYFVAAWPWGDATTLTAPQAETVDSVLKFYGDKNPQWLSDLTHAELPWREAREGLAQNDRGDRVISLESMAEYYANLQPPSV